VTERHLNVGVVGLGTFGSVHVDAYHSYHRCRLKALCDVDERRGRKMARRYGANFYTDYEEMFSEGGIEAVSIATPDFLHRDPAVKAAEAGLDILLEKPMATTVEDAEAINRDAKRAGSKLMVDFHNRFSPPFVSLKRSIEKGELGTPEYLQARLNDTIYVPTKMLGWSARSNVLWFLGSHLVDLSRWLLGSNPTKAYSVAGGEVLKAIGIETPDFYQSVVAFESGAVASLENCWVLPKTHPTIYKMAVEFVGSEGSFSANISHSNVAEKLTRKRRENIDVLGDLDIHGRPRGFTRESIWHFVDSVLDGRGPLVTGEDGLWVTRTITSLLESAGSGEPVKIRKG